MDIPPQQETEKCQNEYYLIRLFSKAKRTKLNQNKLLSYLPCLFLCLAAVLYYYFL